MIGEANKKMKISEAAIAELKLRHPCCDVAAQWVRLRKRGKKYIGPCPLHSSDPNARDSTSFECDADCWVCAVCHTGGDVLKLVALYHGLDPAADFRAVVDLLGGVTEPSPERAAELEKERALRKAQREKEANEYREQQRRRAFAIWHAGEAWPGSPVERYLREARGIADMPPLPPRALRFAPIVAYFDGEEIDEAGRKSPRVVYRGPAMLAPIVDASGVFRGVHVTWLDPAQPNGKAVITNPKTGEVLESKKVYGSVAGNYIPLIEAPPLAPGADDRGLGGYAGEGIETVLSVYAALARAGHDLSRAWFRSTISLGNLAGASAASVRHPTLKDKAKRARRVPGPEPEPSADAFPVPHGTSDVVLLGDGDSDPFTTACALRRGSLRLEARGVSARVAMAPAGEDFNDQLRGSGGVLAVDAAIAAAAPIADPTVVVALNASAANFGRESGTVSDQNADPAPATAPAAPPAEQKTDANAGDSGADVIAFPAKSERKRKAGKRKKGKEGAGGDSADEPPREPNAYGYDVNEMNRRYALVILGSKPVIYVNTPEAREVKDRKRFISLNAFDAWHANRFTEYRDQWGDIKKTTWAAIWMRSRKRREFFGVEFSPPDNDGNPVNSPGYLNLWGGFAYVPAEKPDPMRYKTFRDHLLNNVCGGDQSLFRWVFGFLARIVQRPRERIGVALVLRGDMGTGKTKVGEIMGRIIPEHYFLVDHPRYVTGNFNVHMATCLLLQADEAVWAGDKTAEGRLKSLITSPAQPIEAKGIDPIWVQNFVTLILTSNEDWVVPAGKDERRFAVLDVDPRCAQNSEYFAEMDRELENGGFEHLLGALLCFPLDSVNLRQIPRTKALLEQKVQSLNSIESWWYGRLMAGAPTHKLTEWKNEIPTQHLFLDYIESSDQVGIKRKKAETEFGTKLGKLCPSLRRTRPRMIVDDGLNQKSGRVHCILLPDLQTARAEMDARLQQSADWPPDDECEGDSASRERDVVPL